MKNKSNKIMSKKRSKIINGININMYNDNTRWILDEALAHNNMEDKLEYREKDIKHLMVNNIRHDRSNYNNGLRDIYKISKDKPKSIRDLNYRIYKNSVLDDIARKYPYLRKQCHQQKYTLLKGDKYHA